MQLSNKGANVLKYGTTRTVCLIGKFALKLPTLVEWRLFLLGLLANMQERKFATTKHPKLCPVLWSVPGGWLVVMRRADPLSRTEFYDFADKFDEWVDDEAMRIPVEAKHDSFGRVGGRIVAIDYGN